MKLLYGLTHPIQYQSPMLRHLVVEGVEVEVLYARGETRFFDKEFGREVCWDVPLLEGYPHTVLNESAPSGTARELQQRYLAQILDAARTRKPDALWIHGWSDPYALAFWKAAAVLRRPLLLRGDTCLCSVEGGRLRRLAHRLYYGARFRRVAAFLAIGKQNRHLYESYGVPRERIFDMPYAVDNVFFQQRIHEARHMRGTLRSRLAVEPGRPLVLFAGKLIDLKGVPVFLEALRLLMSAWPENAPRPCLLLAGEGERRAVLEARAESSIPGCTRFLGFQNQSELPALYDLCDVFVLPSNREAFGLVVNEAMNAGRPVIASDRVGCWPDLVRPGVNGAVFPAGDARALAEALRPFLLDASLRERAGRASLEIINRWSFEEDLAGLRAALEFVRGR